MTEAQFQQAVVDLARRRGWLAFHTHDSRRGLGAGFPDLVLVHEATGELLFVELKTTSGRVSQVQQQWLDALQRGGHDARVWRPAHFSTCQIQNALTVRPTREDH
ncbi:VRR-NUC domain-containing protein [Klenkia brasiliensis]|uniref:VRR-NUC domain-containing protein n=1 Tax=Klenkia brasiliensis TaxID=333142 RepID=A0A1G7YHU2_9ACTN|nr:VRR-NUC domain-containing protein [Klenkia brasiliensis]SDG95856.1 VRR-NUC domain-containing protein [Klenkia brasiliensis]